MTLRDILKKHGIKQSVVAKALGIHVNAISRYDELAKRSMREISTISKATGLTLSELLGDDFLSNFFLRTADLAYLMKEKTDVVKNTIEELNQSNKKLIEKHQIYIERQEKMIDELLTQIKILRSENEILKNKLNDEIRKTGT